MMETNKCHDQKSIEDTETLFITSFSVRSQLQFPKWIGSEKLSKNLS